MTRPRRRFLKLTIGAELRRQLVTSVRVRRVHGRIKLCSLLRVAFSVRSTAI